MEPKPKDAVLISQEKQMNPTEKAIVGSKRKICPRCNRPTPRTCLCEALPEQRIRLEKTIILVLQHPHEIKMKNRSIPILELCLDPECLVLCVGRRLGDKDIDDSISKLLQPPNLPILLFPADEKEKDGATNPLSLTEVKEKVGSEELLLQDGGKVVLVALDATWKFAKEMHKANIEHKQYPSQMVLASLQPQDFPVGWTSGRFSIRTTPTDSEPSRSSYMSTAECITLAVSKLEYEKEETQTEFYSTLMKPLDLMVEQWRSFITNPKVRIKKKKKTAHSTREDQSSPSSSIW